MNDDELQALIEEATADFAVGDNEPALAKLARATAAAPASFAAWHALAEVTFSLRRLDEALAAAERAHALDPADLFINTTLSPSGWNAATSRGRNTSGPRRGCRGGRSN